MRRGAAAPGLGRHRRPLRGEVSLVGGLSAHWSHPVLLCPQSHYALNINLIVLFSDVISGLGGGIWRVVLGDWDRAGQQGGEVEMVVDTVLVHPNFTQYQDDVGNTGAKPGLSPS